MQRQDKRQAALAWAAKGLRVFPLQPGTKLPYRNSDWTKTATRDPSIVAALWTDTRTGGSLEHNIGVLCDEMIVVDVDVKHVGVAEAQFSLFDLDLPDTLVTRTPSGGWHHYLTGPNVALSVGKLGRGIDIRSFHGYVVAPGSWLDPKIPDNKGIGGFYEVEHDAPVATAPQHLISRCDAPRTRRNDRDDVLVELDKPEAINEASFYLDQHAPAAIEGAGGDMTTFKVAAHLRDLGVSSSIALKLMWERWNDRCSPPWDWEALGKKVENAFAYSQNPAGAKAAAMERAMDGVTLDNGVAFEGPVSQLDACDFRPIRDAEQIPERPWIVEPLLCRKLVTVIAAKGSTGKTALGLALAAHVATGKPYAGMEIQEATNVLFLSLEDDRDELELRMNAVCKLFDFDKAEISRKVMIEEMLSWKLAIGNGRIPVVQEHEIEALGRLCARAKIGTIIIDPLRKAHTSDENDSLGMDVLMTAFTRIARLTGAAILLFHHSGNKDGKAGSGDASFSRGSSAIPDASRITATMVPATVQDVDLGVPRGELDLYVRLDIAKINIGRKPSKPIWFRKTPYSFGRRRETFGMVHVSVEKRVHDDLRTLEEDIRRYVIEATGPQTYPIRAVAVQLHSNAPGYDEGEGKTRKDQINALTNKLKSVFKRDGRRVRVGDAEYTIRYQSDLSAGSGEARHVLVIE